VATDPLNEQVSIKIETNEPKKRRNKNIGRFEKHGDPRFVRLLEQCVANLMAVAPRASQFSGHEHAVRIFNVVRKRSASLEPKTTVQAASRREGLHGACFEA